MRTATAWGGRSAGVIAMVIAMRRVGLIVALGALLGLLAGAATASPALAGRGPRWQFVPPAPTFNLKAEFCGFKIQVTQVADKEFSKELKTADGSMAFLTTGVSESSFTNPANGKTITAKATGNFTFIVFPDGSITALEKGIGANALAPADAARFGLPGVFVAARNLTVSLDVNGLITSLSLHGHVLVDVCAALS
jgi:hypothetical protein